MELRKLLTDRYTLPTSLSIPYGRIDAEHAQVLEILNSALSLIDKPDGVAVLSIDKLFEEFLVVLTTHFEHEELEMSALNCPGLEAHKLGHSNCIKRIDDLRRLLAIPDTKLSVGHLDEMYDVLIHDVIKADSEFKTFLYAQNILR